MVKRATYAAARRAIESGETTCVKITEQALLTIEENKGLNVFLSVFKEHALEQAQRVDRKFSAGTAGRLAGMVMAIKDVICMNHERATCGSKILEHFVSLYDATAVRRLAAEDVVFIGKTNMDEFAMGSSSEHSAFGPVLNPWDTTRVPG